MVIMIIIIIMFIINIIFIMTSMIRWQSVFAECVWYGEVLCDGVVIIVSYPSFFFVIYDKTNACLLAAYMSKFSFPTNYRTSTVGGLSRDVQTREWESPQEAGKRLLMTQDLSPNLLRHLFYEYKKNWYTELFSFKVSSIQQRATRENVSVSDKIFCKGTNHNVYSGRRPLILCRSDLKQARCALVWINILFYE